MKLLLDEMWSPQIAQQLRNRGYDVLAVAERPDLRGAPDANVFDAAQAEGRAIVTENVPDFRFLGLGALAQRRTHAGLIFTSDRTFPRGNPRTPGRLVAALNRFLVTTSDLTNNEHWLSAA